MFKQAMFTNDASTLNGMVAHSTTSSGLLDFFSQSGAVRTWPESKIVSLFHGAVQENPDLAFKALFYARDIRGGQGERRLFRTIIRSLAENDCEESIIKNLPQIVKYGRWDDLMVFENTPVQPYAAAIWAQAIVEGDALAAKWAPRKGAWFGLLRKAVGMDAQAWRKTLVHFTKVVETQMCNQEWNQINYSHVPSRAGMIYRKAFSKHDTERYVKFIEDAKKGKVKINSATLYPSDIVGRLIYAYKVDETLEAQWKQLPNWLHEDETGILPLVDVSGSMNGQPLNVAIGLGIYVAERNNGAFKDLLVTFSEKPVFVDISKEKTLREKVQKVHRSQWDMNTNLEKALTIMLKRAVDNDVPQSDMPSTLLIISDMQFDRAITLSDSALKMIQRQYADAKYVFPEIVFWNVNAYDNQPAKKNDKGVSLVSGYSPSIMKALLAKRPQATPYELMLDVLSKYEDVNA